MFKKEEQVKSFPPPPAAYEEYSDPLPTEEFMGRGPQRCIKWGGCCFAMLSIVVVVLLVLMLTVFHIRDPVLNIDYSIIVRRHNSTILESDVSVENPNVASFKFSNMSVYVYKEGSVIGQSETLVGEVGARRTLRTSLEIEVRGLKGESGMLSISSYVWISGKVRISSSIKRMLVVRMNCTMNVNLSSQRIEEQNCRMRVSL